jgi:hypothetical protein
MALAEVRLTRSGQATSLKRKKPKLARCPKPDVWRPGVVATASAL